MATITNQMTPDIAKRAVRDATFTGLFALAVSLALTLVYASGAGFAHVDLFNWIELIVLAALSVGLWRGSRIAAVMMLVFFVGTKLYFWIDEQAFIGMPIALVMAWFFWRGVRGTFALAERNQRLALAS